MIKEATFLVRLVQKVDYSNMISADEVNHVGVLHMAVILELDVPKHSMLRTR